MLQKVDFTKVLDILLIEDSEADHYLFEQQLPQMNPYKINLTWVSKVGDLSKESLKGYDAIITDLNVPPLNGLETLRFLIEKSPETPVFIYSSDSDRQRALESGEEGASGYFLKGAIDSEQGMINLFCAIGKARRNRKIKRETNQFLIKERDALEKIFLEFEERKAV